ncbi:MAG TPA: hypothetical protein VM734_31100 [Kofleriaceae bacterium]|nr:hypothetical protein [Kofleriaceae bacterium]
MNGRRWIELVPALAVGVIALVLAIAYAHVFAGEVAGDDNTFHYAETARIAEAVAHGDWDWWNPSANGGFPTGYYYQLIPAAVPGILAGLFGKPLFWFQLGIWLPLVLAPIAAYRALRVLELDRWAALGGAIALAFCVGGSKWGNDGVLLVGLYTQGWALCAYPLAIAYGVRWMQHGRHLGHAAGWGLFVGLCHPVAGVALAPALFIIGLALTGWVRPWWRPPVRLVVLGVLLLIGSAPAWLPVLVHYDAFGGFPHRVSDEVGPGFELLARWFFDEGKGHDGKVFGRGYLLDAGRAIDDYQLPILTVLLVPALVYAIVVAALRRGNQLVLLWTSAIVLAFILGVGRSLPKTDDDLFPAVRVMGPMQVTLALAVGAAVGSGVAWAIRALERVDLGEIAQAVIAAVAGLLVIVYAVPGISVLGGRALVATDYELIYRDELDQLMPAIRAAPPGRIQTRKVENHWFMLLPYVYGGKPALVAYGGAALQSSPNFVYLHSLPPIARAAWIYDAPLVLTRKGNTAAGGHVLATTEHFELRELPSPGLVGPVQVTGTLPAGRKPRRKAVLAWQASDAPLRNEVLAHHGSGGAGPPGDGEARDIRRDGSRITARLEARAPTTFAIRESWHPAWRATVDGRDVPVRRISPDMMAVDVGPGSHTLALHFARPLWTWLLYLLIPLTIAAGWLIARRRRDDPPR